MLDCTGEGMLKNIKFHFFFLRMSTTSVKMCWLNGWTRGSESFSNLNNSRILMKTLRIVFGQPQSVRHAHSESETPNVAFGLVFTLKKSMYKGSRGDLCVSLRGDLSCYK